MNASIEDAIKKRLELQGYTFNEDNPNLLIAYRLFYDDLKITSYHQPLLENWMRYGNESEEYDPVQLDLKKGTLFVIMRDHEQDNTVWQGYASSVFGNDNFDNDRYIKNVTRSMFDQYRIFAHDNLLADNRKRH